MMSEVVIYWYNKLNSFTIIIIYSDKKTFNFPDLHKMSSIYFLMQYLVLGNLKYNFT